MIANLTKRSRVVLTGLLSLLMVSQTAIALDELPRRRVLIIDNWNYSEDVLGKLEVSRFTSEKIRTLERIFNAPVTVFAQGGPNYTIGKADVITKISSFLDAFDSRENGLAYIYIHAHGGKFGPAGEEQASLYSEAARLEQDGHFTRGETILEEDIARVIQNAKNDNSRLKIFLFIDACSQAKTEKKKTMSDRQFRWAAVSKQQSKQQKLTYRNTADLTMFAGLGSVREEDNIYSQLVARFMSGHLKQRLSVSDFKRAAKSDFIYFGTQISDVIFRETKAALQFDGFSAGALVQESTLPVFLHQPNIVPAATYSFTIREDRGNYTEDYYLRRTLKPGLNYLFTPDSGTQVKGRLVLRFPANTGFQDGALLAFSIDGDQYNAAYDGTQKGFVSKLLPGDYGLINYQDQVVAQHFSISSNSVRSFTLKTPVRARDVYIPSAVDLNFLKKSQFDYITQLYFPNQLIIDNDGFLYNDRQVQYFVGNVDGNFFSHLKYANGRLYGLEDRWLNITGDDTTLTITFPEAIKDFSVISNGGGYALARAGKLYEFSHAGDISETDLKLDGTPRNLLRVGNQIVIIVNDQYNRYNAYRYSYQEGKLTEFRLEGVVSEVYQLNEPYIALVYRDRIRILDLARGRELPLVPALSQHPNFLYHRDQALYMDFNGHLFQVTVRDSQPQQTMIIRNFPQNVDPNNTIVFGHALITLKKSRNGSAVEVVSDEGQTDYELNDAVNRMYLYGQQIYFTSDQVLLTYAIAERQMK